MFRWKDKSISALILILFFFITFSQISSLHRGSSTFSLNIGEISPSDLRFFFHHRFFHLLVSMSSYFLSRGIFFVPLHPVLPSSMSWYLGWFKVSLDLFCQLPSHEVGQTHSKIGVNLHDQRSFHLMLPLWFTILCWRMNIQDTLPSENLNLYLFVLNYKIQKRKKEGGRNI